MDFDLEAWWERNGKGFKNADIYTSECEVYDLCSGLVGDVLCKADSTLISPNDLRQLKLLAFKMGADAFRRRMEDWLNDTFEYENSRLTVHNVRETLIATTAEMSRTPEDL